jgi:hypothetical protein
MWRYKTGVMKNKMRVRLPGWVWGTIGVLLFAVVMLVAVRNVKRGLAVLPPVSVIKIPPGIPDSVRKKESYYLQLLK